MTRLLDLPFGGAIAYSDDGSGRPVVLIHGHGGARAFFDRNVRPLSERFRVINLDLPGHGESPPREAGHTMEQYARDVKHLLTSLELEGVVLVGWSMGSFVIWDLIRQFGVEGLAGHVIVDCGPTDLNGDDWELGVMSMHELLLAFGQAQATEAAPVEDEFDWLFIRPPEGPERSRLIDQMERLGANARACSLISQTTCDYRDVIGTYVLPTLCLWGRQDQVLPVANAEWLAEHAGAEVVILDDAGHASMWDQADRFNGAVGDWITDRMRSSEEP